MTASVLLALLSAAPALSARLEYLRPPSLDGCADEAELSQRVAARLGRNPFELKAPRTLRVELSPRGDEVVGLIELSQADGGRPARRELTAPDCAQLAEGLQLAIALILNPPSLPAPPPLLPPPPEPPSSPLVMRLTAGAAAQWGLLPSTSWMGGVGLEGERVAWSIALELRGSAPQLGQLNGASLRAQYLGAALRGCLRSGSLGACPQLEAGSLWMDSGIDFQQPRSFQAFSMHAGARLFAQKRMLSRFGARLYLHAAVALTRSRFLSEGNELWATSPWTAGLGVELYGASAEVE